MLLIVCTIFGLLCLSLSYTNQLNYIIMKNLINDFIKTYGVKVRKNESTSYVDLMMDNHICIEFEDKEYYIAEDNSFYTEDDLLIYDYLKNCCHV